MAKKKAADQSKAVRGKRYSDEEKAEILQFVEEQGRGGAAAAAKKYGVSPITISGWKKSGSTPSSPAKSANTSERDEVLRFLANKGFKIARLMNILTGEVVEEKVDPKIEKLNLEFKALKGRADDGVTYVTQTSGQILVSMTIERLLTLTGTKP